MQTELTDSDLTRAVEVPEVPEITSRSAVNFAAWLYQVKQAVGGLSDRTSRWFALCLTSARQACELWEMSDPFGVPDWGTEAFPKNFEVRKGHVF